MIQMVKIDAMSRAVAYSDGNYIAVGLGHWEGRPYWPYWRI